jgi:hypothetical protein
VAVRHALPAGERRQLCGPPALHRPGRGVVRCARPIILNGIEDVVSRPDLADRALFLTLPWVSEARRRPEQQLWQAFELLRPRRLGALLDALSHGLRALPQVRLDRLPRMADFALWATACETDLWPAGTFARAYAVNRRAAIVDAIDADPVAACVRELMADRSRCSWAGSAADLLRASADHSRDGIGRDRTAWPQNPRALAGRLRRAQTFLRALGIDIAFSREGRVGSRVIRMRTTLANTVSTVSSRGNESAPIDTISDDSCRQVLDRAGVGHGRRRC